MCTFALLEKYYIINKPFNMLSQFVSVDDTRLLGKLDFAFPEGIHAIGRLDCHSEGLLILTTDKKITKLLFNSKQPHTRTYLVQVLKVVSAQTVQQLEQGVNIRIRGGDYWVTSPCQVSIIEEPQNLIELEMPFQKFIPHTWLRITLTEGKYHQVRKMVAVVGHKCKRLVRTSIDNLELGDLESGGVMELEKEMFFELLGLKKD
jgi:23S rRNA pseudouridine2457 synthase